MSSKTRPASGTLRFPLHEHNHVFLDLYCIPANLDDETHRCVPIPVPAAIELMRLVKVLSTEPFQLVQQLQAFFMAETAPVVAPFHHISLGERELWIQLPFQSRPQREGAARRAVIVYAATGFAGEHLAQPDVFAHAYAL